MQAGSRERVPVAIIGIRGLPPRYGGGETASDELGRRLVERGHDVVVYCRLHNHAAPRPTTWNGMRLVHLPSLHTKNLDTPTHIVLCALHLVFRERAKVVLLSGVGTSFIIPWLRLFGRKSVMWADGQDWKRGKWGRVARAFLKWSAEFTCRVSNGIVTDTTIAHRFYREQLRRETTYIPYGANIERVEGDQALREHGVEPGRYLLFVGRLIPEKGVHYLIEAFEGLRTDLKLVIVGDSPYTPDYVHRLRSTRDPRIVFTGYLFGDGFKQLMKNCRIYVQPSDVEGTSPVLLTAMGYGRPVVVNGIAENRATIGDAGIAFEPGDVEQLRSVLAELVDDPHRLEELGRRSEHRVRTHYSWERITDEFEDLFDALVEGRPPRTVIAEAESAVPGDHQSTPA
jgi:glycosyltransferase involved in cell wall biosynthesis